MCLHTKDNNFSYGENLRGGVQQVVILWVLLAYIVVFVKSYDIRGENYNNLPDE